MSTNDIKNMKDTVEQSIRKSSNVFLIGHNSPDFDSIGSCLGLSEIATAYKKDSFIIIDDIEERIEPGVKRIMDENRENYHFIKKSEVKDKIKEKSLLIIADTNKINTISIPELLPLFPRVIIIDHHREDEYTIQKEHVKESDSNNKKETLYKFIDLEISSVSELVTGLLHSLKIKYSPIAANALLAGISLDSHRFTHNTTAKTHDIAEKLMENGANMEYVNRLFLQGFEEYRRIRNLIINGTIFRIYNEDSLSPIQVSFTLNRDNPKTIYAKEDFAKVADRMMGFENYSAAFALGYVDEETIHISARSGDRVNVGIIMEAMSGGGTPKRAGTTVKSNNILEVEEELINKVALGISSEETLQEHPIVVKMKKM